MYIFSYYTCVSSFLVFFYILIVNDSCQHTLSRQLIFLQHRFFFVVIAQCQLDFRVSTQINSAQLSSAQLSSAQLNSAHIISIISSVPFLPVLTCPISHWTAGILVCFHFIPNISVQCQIEQVITGGTQLNSIQFSSAYLASAQPS